MPLLTLAVPAPAGLGTLSRFLLRLAAIAMQRLNSNLQGGRGHCLDHQVSYIGIGAGAAFFARRVFRFAALRLPALRFVFRAAPRAPALRTVRFFARFFVFFFLAVIGM